MESDHFFASIGVQVRGPNSSSQKDVGIFRYQWQPPVSQEQAFKKSATLPNSLAATQAHIFAAQADKAVVNVYSTERNNQEAIVPFPERISALALAADNCVLILGSAEGRIFLWELFSGRLVTAPQSHLQAVTALAVDPTSNFLLSGSSDANIHIWSITALLNFARLPGASSQASSQTLIHTLTEHGHAIAALACGHSYGSSTIAVSTARDSTAIVWDLRKGIALRTFLLDGIARALAMDVLDRGFYIAYEDGSVQLVDLYDTQDSPPQPVQSSRNSHQTIQPRARHRWTMPGAEDGSDVGAALCLLLSWDGSRLLSGHQSGAIVSWQVATGICEMKLGTLPGPVTNLVSLPSALPSNRSSARLTIKSIVKPRHGTTVVEEGALSLIPDHYTPVVQFSGLTDQANKLFSEVIYQDIGQSSVGHTITHPSFPLETQQEGLAELASWGESKPDGITETVSTAEEYMALDEESESAGKEPQTVEEALRKQNSALMEQVMALQRLQDGSFIQLRHLREEKKLLLEQKLAADERHIEDQSAIMKALGIRNPAIESVAPQDRSSSALEEGESSSLQEQTSQDDRGSKKKRKLENG